MIDASFLGLYSAGMVKQTSIAEATAIVGTCPDMCPEKERYNREDTRRLSYFEVLLQEFNERGVRICVLCYFVYRLLPLI